MKDRPKHSISSRVLGLMGLTAILLLMGISVTKGAADIPLSTLIDSIRRFDKTNTHHLMMIDLRLPRVLTSALVGSALAVAGAIMQGTTRNPMADSGLMGVNAGAGLAIALCFAFMPGIRYEALIAWAFLGAAMGTLMIAGIAFWPQRGATPMRIVLAGAAVSALLAALSQGIALSFHVGVGLLFWTVGGVVHVTWSQVYLIAPLVLIGLLGALLLSPFISMMSMGEEVAKGLGIRTTLLQFLCGLVVLVLAGTSVSLVGAVSFVGLMVPHLARFLLGVDYRKIIPGSAVLGALLLIAADLGARTINPPFEVPLGVLTSLLGVPFFLYLSRKTRREG